MHLQRYADMPQRTSTQLIIGTIIAALIYSAILWSIILPSWLAGGGWKVLAIAIFALWVFFFFGFTLRHIINYARNPQKNT